MAGKILGIEIGTQMTHVVEMDFKVKTPKIYQFFSLPTPENAVMDGSVKLIPEFIESIKSALTEHKVKTKKVIFVMNSTRIANREVVIPVVKEKQIHDLLITNSAEFFPVDLLQYQLVHNIIEKNEEEKKYKLSVFAVPNEIVDSYLAFAKELNLEIEALDYIGNSISQGMLRLLKEQVNVTIKVDEKTSMLTLERENKVELQRNISYGISEAVETLMDSRAYGEITSFSEAMSVLQRERCVNPDFERKRESGGDEKSRLREDVTDSVRALVGNIGRILDYYTSRNQDIAIDNVWLIGLGAGCQGLSELLTNELNVNVRAMTEIPEMIQNRSAIQDTFKISEYLAPIAGTLNPLAFGLEKKSEEKGFHRGSELFVPGLVCGICLTIAAVLVAGPMITSVRLENQQQELTRQIDALQEAEDIYQEYELTMSEYSHLQEMYQLTKTPDDRLLAFLGEMEAKMPSEMVVETMSAGTDGVTMSVRVGEKAAAAEALIQLRDFSTLSSVSTSGITEAFDGTGKNSITFSVSCTYAAEPETEIEE